MSYNQKPYGRAFMEDQAMRCKEEGVSRAILFNLSGHGHFDMQGTRTTSPASSLPTPTTERELAMAIGGLPSVPDQ